MKFSYLKCRPKNHPFPIVAWIIMLFQGMKPWHKSATSHRALMYQSGLRYFVIDSTGPGGVEIKPLDEFSRDYLIIDKIDFENDIHIENFYEWTREVDKLLYDRGQMFGLLLKTLGFVSFNFIGSNFKKLICNEVFVLFCEDFYNFESIDSDNWDLVMTDRLAIDIAKGKYDFNTSKI